MIISLIALVSRRAFLFPLQSIPTDHGSVVNRQWRRADVLIIGSYILLPPPPSMQFIFNKRGGDDTQPLGVKGCSWESGHQLHGCFISPAGPELCKGTVAWVWNRKTQNKEENGEWLNKLKTVSLKTDNISNKFEMQYFGNSNGNWILKATFFILINGLGTKSLVLRTKHMTKNMGHLSCLGDVVALWPSGPSLLGQRSRVRIRHLPQWSCMMRCRIIVQ